MGTPSQPSGTSTVTTAWEGGALLTNGTKISQQRDPFCWLQKTQFQYESTNGDPSKAVVKVESVNTNSPSESVQGRLGAGAAGCVPFREFLLNRIRMNQGAWMILAVRDLCLVAFRRCFFPGNWRATGVTLIPSILLSLNWRSMK